MNIDFRLIKKYGLSLNDKKKYHMIYCCHTWTLWGVFDDLNEAIIRTGRTVEEYEKQCNRDFEGHNDIFYKGFIQNLNVWELLDSLCECIDENVNRAMESIKYNGLYEGDNVDEIKEQYRMLESVTDSITSIQNDTKIKNKTYKDESINRYRY